MLIKDDGKLLHAHQLYRVSLLLSRKHDSREHKRRGTGCFAFK